MGIPIRCIWFVSWIKLNLSYRTVSALLSYLCGERLVHEWTCSSPSIHSFNILKLQYTNFAWFPSWSIDSVYYTESILPHNIEEWGHTKTILSISKYRFSTCANSTQETHLQLQHTKSILLIWKYSFSTYTKSILSTGVYKKYTSWDHHYCCSALNVYWNHTDISVSTSKAYFQYIKSILPVYWFI